MSVNGRPGAATSSTRGDATGAMRVSRIATLLLPIALTLSACSSGPPTPAWQMDAKSSLDRGVNAWLAGDTRVATAEFARARSAMASTGRPDLLARAELVICAAQVASLVLDPCDRFETLRNDAAPAERAYADYLQGRVAPASVAQLPEAQRGVAKAADEKGLAAALRDVDDPLSRLVAAGVLFRAGRANPAAIALAIETASTQGWRRPLLAWLGVERKRAEAAGDNVAVERVRRRMELVEQGGATK